MSEIVSRIQRELAQPDPSLSHPRPRWPRFLLSAGLFALTPLLLCEILVRAVWTPPPRIPASARMAASAEATARLNRRFGYEAFVSDRILLWKLRPGANLEGIPISTRGLLAAPDSPFPVSRRGGSLRILVLGDSVPALTYRPFPSLVQRLARLSASGADLVVLNAAVPGYSSEQGLRRFQQLADLRPDVVVIAFGLADASPALNGSDQLLLGGIDATPTVVQKLFRWLRTAQWLASRGVGHPAEDEGQQRVKLERFGQNLGSLVRLVREHGAVPVLVTEPGSVSFLESYNRTIRSVAQEAGVTLLDLHEELTRRERGRLLEADQLHLTPVGHNLAARILLGLLHEMGLIKAEAMQSMADLARYDSAAPDELSVEWTLFPRQMELPSGATTVTLSTVLRNAGNTRWLKDHIVERFGDKRDLDYGGVRVQARWRSEGASETAAPAAVVQLPQDVLPGESTSVTLALSAPHRPGVYSAELGIMTCGLGALSRLGASVTTFTLTLREGK